MNRSRIIQALVLLVLFALAVALFSGGGGPAIEDNSGYVPPAP